MTRGRSDGAQKKCLLTSVCIVAVFLVFLYVYFGSKNAGESALEYGSRLRKLGSLYLGGDEDSDLGGRQDESSMRFALDEGNDNVSPRSFPVCDDRHSELIPCLDRNLIYQTRLKLDLSLMEHYERHCPSSEWRFNCLIPPPPGYKVPIKWPKSRDEVWKVNIPHTHLAHEKSDQNWMVVKGEKINFPGGGTHFHYGTDKYCFDRKYAQLFKQQPKQRWKPTHRLRRWLWRSQCRWLPSLLRHHRHVSRTKRRPPKPNPIRTRERNSRLSRRSWYKTPPLSKQIV